MSQLRVAAIIPCHNEEESIEKTLASLCNQSHPLDEIVVIDDYSSDQTPQILKKAKNYIPHLTILTSLKPLSRAGALNWGLKHILPTTDFVLRLDADTVVHPSFVHNAVGLFQQIPSAGGFCSRAGLFPGKGLLYRLQKMEYGAGFDAERIASFDNVLVLHGMCTIYRFSVLKVIGGFTVGHRIEDYEATLRIKYAGYQARFHPSLLAFTLAPKNLWSLLKQRYRWIRGGVDIVIEHGINKYTIGDVLDHLFFVSVLGLLGALVFLSLREGGRLHFHSHPVSVTLGVVTYLISLYKLKYVQRLELKDIFLRMIILPELILTLLFSFLQLYAYMTALCDLVRSFIQSYKHQQLTFRKVPLT